MKNWAVKLNEAYQSGRFKRVYQRYLKSKSWEQKKEEHFCNPDNSYCQACYTFKRIQIHHKTYQNVGYEKPEDMVSLCGRCHRDCHKFMSMQLTDEFVKKRQNGDI